MLPILYQNFNPEDAGMAPGEIFESRYRNADFAAVFKDASSYYAVRDHLGNAPLYYRREENGKESHRFSQHLNELIRPDDVFVSEGVEHYLGFSTPKIVSLVKDIRIVPPGCCLRIDRQTGKETVVYRYAFRRTKLPGRSLEDMFRQAVARTVQAKEVGILLSGGIDSAMVGWFLKELGVRMNAYTFAAWGLHNQEMERARFTASLLGISKHEFAEIGAQDATRLMDGHAEAYGGPLGTSGSLAVLVIAAKTSILKESQLYFAQNADTMTCSMPAQYYSYFMSFLPSALRKWIREDLGGSTIADLYLAFASSGAVRKVPPEFSWLADLPKHQALKLAGMLIAHTPSDGEAVAMPFKRKGLKVLNPYYDMDLIEYCLGTLVWPSFRFSKRSRFGLAIEKTGLQAIAAKFLPQDHIRNKKGMGVPLMRREDLRGVPQMFPIRAYGKKTDI